MEITERNQIEILKLNCAIFEMKKFTESLSGILGTAGEEVSKPEVGSK